MKRLQPIAVAGLVAVLAIVGCSSSSPRPYQASVTDVTGFANAAPPAGEMLTGPVTVRVTGSATSRLAMLVRRLPSVPQVHCEEPLGLIYRIVFHAGVIAQSTAVVDGYECDAAVMVTVAGQASWRRDASCTLLRAVRQVLPARARATQSLAIGCDS